MRSTLRPRRTGARELDSKRRASLPGVDELFRSTATPPARTDAQEEAGRPAPGAPPERQPLTPGGEPPGRQRYGWQRETDDVAGDAAAGDAGEGASPYAAARAAAIDRLAEDAVAGADPSGAPAHTSAAVSASVGTLLSFLTTAVDARHAVEIGAPDAAASWWLVTSMAPGGTLTVIGEDAARVAPSREMLASVGSDVRVRTIPGAPSDVLGRLSDRGYELMVVRGACAADRSLRDHALRLLRSGAIVVVLDLVEDPGSNAGQGLVRDLIDDPRFHVALVPGGAGMAVARLTSTA